MPADWNPGTQFVQGFAIGSEAANAAFANGLRLQELKSQDAARRVQEKATAQAMAMKLEEHNQMVQYRADLAKGVAAAELASSPTVAIPGLGLLPNPNPMAQDSAYMRFVVPTVMQNDPKAGIGILENIALRRVQMAREQRMGDVAKAKMDVANRIAEASPEDTQIHESNGVTIVKTPDGKFHTYHKGEQKSYSEPRKIIEDYKAITGKDMSPDDLDKIFKQKGGIEARPAVTRIPSEGDYVSKHIDGIMEQNVILDPKTKKNRRPASRQEGVDYLRSEYGSLYGAKAKSDDQKPAEDTVQVRSPSGKLGKIPRSQIEDAKKQGYTIFDGGKG